jgi:uncharacterized RDD family membrane protein YckC
VTRVERRRAGAPPGSYPWHAAPAAQPAARGGRSLRGVRAGFVTRVLANVVDLLVVVLVVAAGYVGVAATRFLLNPSGFTFPTTHARTLLLVGLAVQAGYFSVTWAVAGGTYGDRLLGLRVVGRRGAPLHWGRCALRAILCTLVPIGLIWVLVSSQSRSAQDLLLGTSVVYDE